MTMTVKNPIALDGEDRRALGGLATTVLSCALLGLGLALCLVGLTLTLALCVRLFVAVSGMGPG